MSKQNLSHAAYFFNIEIKIIKLAPSYFHYITNITSVLNKLR